jgi:predicted aconitase
VFSTASDTDVDFVVIGCPQARLEQIRLVASLLEGKRLKDSKSLWVFARATEGHGRQMGNTETIERPGPTS